MTSSFPKFSISLLQIDPTRLLEYGLNDSPLTFQMDPTWPASADLRFGSSLVQRPVLRHSDVTDVRDGCDVRHVRLVGDWNVLTYQLNPMNCEILRKLAEHLDAFWSYVFKSQRGWGWPQIKDTNLWSTGAPSLNMWLVLEAVFRRQQLVGVGPAWSHLRTGSFWLLN